MSLKSLLIEFFARRRAQRNRPPVPTMNNPGTDPAPTDETTAAACEHWTVWDDRKKNRPAIVAGGINTYEQFAGRFDPNGVALEMPAQPLPNMDFWGYIIGSDGVSRPRGVLEGCAGSSWPVTGGQVLSHLHRILRLTPEQGALPQTVVEFVNELCATDLRYERWGDDPRRLRATNLLGTPRIVNLPDLEAWTVEMSNYRIAAHSAGEETFWSHQDGSLEVIHRLAEEADTVHCYTVHGARERTEHLYQHNKLTPHSFAAYERVRHATSQIQRAEAMSDGEFVYGGFISNGMIANATIDTRGVRPSEFVSSGTDPLPELESRNIESFSSDQGFKPNRRRMRIRGPQ